MRISVVIATYRRAGSLARTLATIASQSRRPDEVIVVDQSAAEEKAAVQKVVAASVLSGLPVRLLQCAEPSSTHARNMGLAAACGDWVVFSDDDVDWPVPVMESLLLKVDANPTLVLVAARDTSVPQRPRPFWQKLLASVFLTDAWGRLRQGKVFACMQARYPQPIVGDMATEWGMGYWFAIDRRFVSVHGLLFDEKMTRYAQAEDMLFTHQLYRLAVNSGRRCVVSEDIAVAHLVSQEWREPDSFADLCGAWNRIYIAAVFRKGAGFWLSLGAIYWAAIHQALVRISRGRGWLGHLRAYVIALGHLGQIRAGRFDELYAAYEKPADR
jgi:glycosyltransferase involved in cell wall biosynthesis